MSKAPIPPPADEQRAKKCLIPIVNEGVARAGGEGSIVIEVPEGMHDALLTTAP